MMNLPIEAVQCVADLLNDVSIAFPILLTILFYTRNVRKTVKQPKYRNTSKDIVLRSSSESQRSTNVSSSASTTMTRLLRNQEWQAALEVFHRIPVSSVPFSCYMLALDAYALAKDCSQVFALISQMETNNVPVNEATYSKVMQCLASAGQWKQVVELPSFMEARGVQPNVIHYNHVIAACSQIGDWETAVRILESINTEGNVVSDTVMYNVALKACMQAAEVQSEEALKLFNRMKSLGVTPDAITYNTMVLTLCKAARLDDSIEILEEAQRFGAGYDQACYGSLILLSVAEGRTDQALQFLNTMTSRSMKPSFNNFRAVLLECCRAGRVQEATETLLTMRSHSFMLTRSGKRAVECATGKTKQWQPFLSVLSQA